MEIVDRIKKIVSEQLGVPVAEVLPEKSFVADFGADSLDTVELVMALEDEFGLEFDDDELDGIQTVQQAIDFITQKVLTA